MTTPTPIMTSSVATETRPNVRKTAQDTGPSLQNKDMTVVLKTNKNKTIFPVTIRVSSSMQQKQSILLAPRCISLSWIPKYHPEKWWHSSESINNLILTHTANQCFTWAGGRPLVWCQRNSYLAHRSRTPRQDKGPQQFEWGSHDRSRDSISMICCSRVNQNGLKHKAKQALSEWQVQGNHYRMLV